MGFQNINIPKPREGWAEMIRQEVERNGPDELLIPDFLTKIIMTGPGNTITL